jgi:hypothetical protein
MKPRDLLIGSLAASLISLLVAVAVVADLHPLVTSVAVAANAVGTALLAYAIRMTRAEARRRDHTLQSHSIEVKRQTTAIGRMGNAVADLRTQLTGLSVAQSEWERSTTARLDRDERDVRLVIDRIRKVEASPGNSPRLMERVRDLEHGLNQIRSERAEARMTRLETHLAAMERRMDQLGEAARRKKAVQAALAAPRELEFRNDLARLLRRFRGSPS